MPIFFNKVIENEIHLMLWQVNESEEELLNRLTLTESDVLEYKNISHEHKRIEYLASRLTLELLVKSLGASFNGVKKDIHGKPFLIGIDWEISLSHSISFVGVAISKTKAIGLDIERPSLKIRRIMPRLFSENEISLANNNIETETVFWSAKECLYKLYGKRQVDFKLNLQLSGYQNKFYGHIRMPNQVSDHIIWFEKIHDFLVVIAY